MDSCLAAVYKKSRALSFLGTEDAQTSLSAFRPLSFGPILMHSRKISLLSTNSHALLKTDTLPLTKHNLFIRYIDFSTA